MANFTIDKDSPHYRTYHLRVPVRSYFWEAVRGEAVYGRTPSPAPLVTLEVGAIKGIQSFYIHEGYELKVHMATAYEWDEIENQLAAAVEKHNDTAAWPSIKERDEPAPHEKETVEDEY